MAVTVTQLRSFLAVVRTGSVTAAAEELVVSQPSVSAAVSALTKELGVDLTERVGRNVRPSPAGRAFAAYAADVIGLLDQGARAAREAADKTAAELRIGALRIFGSPWQPWFHDWAFNLQRGPALAEKWALIPDGVDVLVTHGPPAEILDRTVHGEEVGCRDLRDALERVRPRLHLFGHIHEAHGRLERDGTLYSGDVYSTLGGMSTTARVNPLFPLPTMATWHRATELASAEKLIELAPERLAPGHGRVVELPVPDMRAMVERARKKLKD